MTTKPTAIIEREGDSYVALCPELEAVTQEDTVWQPRHNLPEALTLFFQTAPAEQIEGCLPDRSLHHLCRGAAPAGPPARS